MILVNLLYSSSLSPSLYLTECGPYHNCVRLCQKKCRRIDKNVPRMKGEKYVSPIQRLDHRHICYESSSRVFPSSGLGVTGVKDTLELHPY